MKKAITLILILFSICSRGQINYIFNHSGLDPTIHAHGKPFSLYDLQYFIMDVEDTSSRSSANIALFPGYYSQQSQAFLTDSTAQTSTATVSSEGMYLWSVTNTTPYDQIAHGISITPNYIRIGNPNHSELTESKVIIKLPISKAVTLTNIVTLENDTLKVYQFPLPITFLTQ